VPASRDEETNYLVARGGCSSSYYECTDFPALAVVNWVAASKYGTHIIAVGCPGLSRED
jgi:hypothetical protein